MTVRVRCAVCDKPIEKWEIEHSVMDQSRTLTVFCHGEKDAMKLTDKGLFELGPDVCRALESGKIEGVAFTTNRLEKEPKT